VVMTENPQAKVVRRASIASVHQEVIEEALALKHLREGTLVLYDVSWSPKSAIASCGLGREVPNGASDTTERGINLATAEGQHGIERVLDGADLVILDNLSTLFPNGSESASDAWVPMQNWLLKLRRRGVAVLFVHHAGTNGRQRGTSRREDVLDTVIALRRPENYSPDQGAPHTLFGPGISCRSFHGRDANGPVLAGKKVRLERSGPALLISGKHLRVSTLSQLTFNRLETSRFLIARTGWFP
jgi:AAA domain